MKDDTNKSADNTRGSDSRSDSLLVRIFASKSSDCLSRMEANIQDKEVQSSKIPSDIVAALVKASH